MIPKAEMGRSSSTTFIHHDEGCECHHGDGENTKPRIVVIEISTVLNGQVGCSAKSEVTMTIRGTHPNGVDSPDPFP